MRPAPHPAEPPSGSQRCCPSASSRLGSENELEGRDAFGRAGSLVLLALLATGGADAPPRALGAETLAACFEGALRGAFFLGSSPSGSHASSCVAEFLEVETPSSNRIPRRAPLLSNCRN